MICFIRLILLLGLTSLSVVASSSKEVAELRKRLDKLEEKLSERSFLKTNSEMRLRYQHRTDTPSPNRNVLSDFYDMRLRMKFDYRKDKDLGVIFTPQISKNFGDGTPNDSNRNEGEASGNKLADMGVLEAYLDYQVATDIKLKIGRQALKYGDGLIINNPKFNNVGRVFDGVKAVFDYARGKTDLFASRVNDGESDTSLAGGNTDDDTDFIVWYNRLKVMNVDELDLYVLSYLDRGTGTNQYGKLSTESQEVYSFGLRLKEKVDNFHILTELIFQRGSLQPSSESNLALLELGYTINSKWSLWLESFYIQKDYRPFYTSRHKYLGHLDIFGIRNINSIRFRTKYTLSEKTKFMVDLHNFARNDDESDVYNLPVNNTVGSSSGLDGESDLGQEIDLKFDTKLRKELSLTSGYAYFVPGNYFKEQDLDDSAHYLYAELNYKF